MSDEDILRRALAEGKVVLDGKEFPIKKVDPETIQLQDPNFEKIHAGTYSDLFPYLRRNDPVTYYPELFLPKPKSRPQYQDDTRPEVALREGIRAAIRGGLSAEKIKEIFEHELVYGVMET